MEARNLHSRDEKRPTNSRLRGSLNVVVEKVGATRAMVNGDVSVESLKELLMSSLSLLETEKKGRASKDDISEGRRDLASVSSRAGNEKSKAGTADAEAGFDHGEIKFSKEHQAGKVDAGSKTAGKDFLADVAATRISKTISGKGRTQGRKSSRGEGLAGSKRGLHGGEKGERDAEGEDEELSETFGRLPSCSSISGRDGESSPLSCDGRWLRANFREPLVHALREIVNKNPQDPVEYLAFWLRNYRDVEEKERWQRDFERDLKTLRTDPIPTRNSVPAEYRELEFSDGEEGGGYADENFKNYHPSTPAF